MMPMKQRRIKGEPKSLRQSENPEALSGRSSSIGVEPNQRTAITAIIIYTGKSILQPRPKVGMACVAPHMAIYGARKDAMAFTN